MAKDKSPAYQWYPKDVLSSKRVTLMTLAEEGAYRRALDMCWLSQTLPAEPRALARIIGKNCTVRVAEVVKQMFVEANGELRHERLDEERAKQRKWSEKSSEGGQKSAKTRKSNKQEVNNPINQNATTLQPPLQNGINQKATLQFASSFASSSTNNQQQQSHVVFAEKLFTKECEFDKETIELQLNPKRRITKEDCEAFNSHLHTEQKHHVHWSEYTSHLRNWLNSRPDPSRKKVNKPEPENITDNDIYKNAKSAV